MALDEAKEAQAQTPARLLLQQAEEHYRELNATLHAGTQVSAVQTSSGAARNNLQALQRNDTLQQRLTAAKQSLDEAAKLVRSRTRISSPSISSSKKVDARLEPLEAAAFDRRVYQHQRDHIPAAQLTAPQPWEEMKML